MLYLTCFCYFVCIHILNIEKCYQCFLRVLNVGYEKYDNNNYLL